MMLTSELALARYETALETGEGFREAADMLARALQAKAPKPKGPRKLTDPVKVGKRAKYWGDFTVTWEDGTQTFVSGVIYDRPADRFAAAFQAADRLRRLRGRHGWENEPGAPSRWHTVMGTRRETPEFMAYAMRERALPRCVSVTDPKGGVFQNPEVARA